MGKRKIHKVKSQSLIHFFLLLSVALLEDPQFLNYETRLISSPGLL
jgi:hypothetical protein